MLQDVTVFTEVLKELIKHWRSFGIRIFAFFDDGFGGGNSLEEATRCSNIVQLDLAKSGFIAHPTKSQRIPKQGEHLGFIVNLKDSVFSVPARRLLVLQKKLQRLAEGGGGGGGGGTHSQNGGQFGGYNNFHGLSFRPSC